MTFVVDAIGSFSRAFHSNRTRPLENSSIHAAFALDSLVATVSLLGSALTVLCSRVNVKISTDMKVMGHRFLFISIFQPP